MLLSLFASCNNETVTTDTESEIVDTTTDNFTPDTEETKVTKITDFPLLSNLQKRAERIDITYKANGKYTQCTVTDMESIDIIMEVLFNSTFKEVGKTIPSGGDSFRLDIKDCGVDYVVCESMLYEDVYYEFRGEVETVLKNIIFPPNEYLINGCENNVNPTNIKYKSYYESLALGGYLGKNVPSKNNGNRDFELGIYYEVILDCDSAKAVFSNSRDLDQDFFDVYYVLVIGAYLPTGFPYDIYGFYDMYYDETYDMVRISFDGRDGFDVTVALSTNNFYLKIPKTNESDEYWQNKNTGKLVWNFNSDNYFDAWYSEYKSDKTLDIKEGTSWGLTTMEEINEFGNHYGITPLANWKRNDAYLFVIYMKIPCDVCFAGFKDFHTDGQNVYVTVKNIEYNHNHKYDQTCFVTIEIPKNDTLYSICSEPNFKVLFELNKRQLID